MPVKATEVIDKLKEMVGSFNHEEYFCYGDLQMTVTGVLVCWKARLDHQGCPGKKLQLDHLP